MNPLADQVHANLRSLADWIRATDKHAAFHLPLLDEAERLMSAPAAACAAERSQLAERLERWRYQHLNHVCPLQSEDEALLDALDRVANELAGGPQRPVRATRHAVFDPAYDDDAILEAADLLDPRVPWQAVSRRAEALTRQYFSIPPPAHSSAPAMRRMLLYAPLYVSSQCVNHCLYCGFRYPLDIVRKHLSVEEMLEQAAILTVRGFRHILLVGGDFPSQTTPAYFAELTAALAQCGIEPSLEIAAQTTAAYAALARAGTRGVTLYQETYQPDLYARYHVRGSKSSYHWRLEAHDRTAEAGIERSGLGILLGLAEARNDLRALMRHGSYLARRFPDRKLAFSLPRIHEAPSDFSIPHPVSDEELIRFYCALRVAFPRAELVLSTREPAELRNRLARVCITQMSAGSSTVPGGYSAEASTAGEQFPVCDQRSPTEVAQWLSQEGIAVTWRSSANIV